MNTKKPIAIGVDDFKEIITEQRYYVDKTGLIANVIDDSSKIKLITRPRRFGKTLNLSTLKCFFDCAQKDENRPLFDGLDIEKAKNGHYMTQQGKYPTVFLTLKDMNANNFAEFTIKMKNKLKALFSDYAYLLNSTVLEAPDIFRLKTILLNQDEGSSLAAWCDSLYLASKLLSIHHGEKTVILIDEYDSPIINAYSKTPPELLNAPKSTQTFLSQTIDFFRDFLGAALKTNPYLHTAVLTGITRVSRESIFSDLNNINVYTVLSEYYKEDFGFSEEQTFELLDYYGFDYDKKELREYYDGYNFGKFPEKKTSLYNPWSITKLAKETLDNGDNRPRPEPHWVNTSQDSLFYAAVKKDILEFANAVIPLLEGGTIDRAIQEHTTLADITSAESSWSLLLASGYLTVEAWHPETKEYSLKIPNLEVRRFFDQLLTRTFANEVQSHINMMQLLFSDFEQFVTVLNERTMKCASFRDLWAERDYHNLLLGVLMASATPRQTVRSNRESGSGCYDIVASDGNKTFVFELKHVKKPTKRNIAAALKEAAAQIKSRNYGIDLDGSTGSTGGETVLVPVATGGKQYWF